jgi:adenylate cyclase class 2
VSAGAVETEIKLRIDGAAAGLDLIARVGALPKTARLFESNMVYDTAAGEIRGRGELLRLRETGGQCVLTWKGPGSAGKHKSREETEVLISDARAFDLILRRLGFEPKFRYEKYRTEFTIPDESGVITLDETPIGCFLELEGTPQWIDSTAARMGFTESDYVTLSYGSLYIEHCASSGVSQGWMVFQPEITHGNT